MNILKLLFLYYIRFFAQLAIFIANPVHIVGVTGSVGKSSTRNALDVILSSSYKTKTIFEGNSETGIPLGLLGLKPRDYSYVDWLRLLVSCPFNLFHLVGTQVLIVEMGIDDPFPPKNMRYLLTIVKPDICLFLNVHSVHAQQFEKLLVGASIEKAKQSEFLLRSIAIEKGRLITQNPKCKVAIYNGDNAYVAHVIDEYKKTHSSAIRFFSFGTTIHNGFLFKSVKQTLSGTQFLFSFNTKISRDHNIALMFKDQIFPKAYLEVLSSAMFTAWYLQVPLETIISLLEADFRLPKGRGSIFEGVHGTCLIDSTYNASTVSTIAYLELLATLKKHHNRPSAFVFGDMNELGSQSEAEHIEIARICAKSMDYIYLIGPLTKKYVLPFLKSHEKKVLWFENSKLLGVHLMGNVPKNTIVLFKASQNNLYLEEAIKPLLKNKHDEKKLCRQNEYWMKKKLNFFS